MEEAQLKKILLEVIHLQIIFVFIPEIKRLKMILNPPPGGCLRFTSDTRLISLHSADWLEQLLLLLCNVEYSARIYIYIFIYKGVCNRFNPHLLVLSFNSSFDNIFL